MTGLRDYERDLNLPCLGGDAHLRLPAQEDFVNLVTRYLHNEGASVPRSACIRHARWKPGVSCVGTWSVELEDGSEQLVTFKRYAGNKAAETAERDSVVGDRHLSAGPLRPFAFVEDLGACLWTFPADRSLRGASRIMNASRSARMLDTMGVTAPYTTKGSLSVSELLRYKPERRLVAKFSARLHRPAPKPRMRDFILRALAPAEAAESARCRAALKAAGGAPFLPEMLGHEAASGIIIEQFIEGTPHAHDDFKDPERVGTLLAELHSLHVAPEDQPSTPAARDWDPSRLFAVHPDLAEFERLPLARHSGIVAWVHGDLHPDQLMTTTEGQLCLLDLDGLSVGDPVEDLASWIADALAHDPQHSYGDAAEALLAGYRAVGGPEISPACLMRHVATSLQERAAASIRRLEVGAAELAEERMRRAAKVWRRAQEVR